MKIKVYVVDVKLPRWARRTLVFGGVPAVLLGLCALVYASAVVGQPDYADGDVLTAATLNAHLGALQNQVPPPKAVVLTTLLAADLADATKFSTTGLGVGAYLGWAVCNGNNGTVNLTGKFPRMVAVGAGATGGEDSNAHTHGMQSHTHDRLAHQHQTDIGWDNLGYLYGKVIADSTPADGSIVEVGAYGLSAPGLFSYVAGGPARFAMTRTDGSGNTGGPSSNTTTAASDTENRPAFYELVPLCKT